MSDDDDTVPATASQVAAALKGGDIDALVELAKTLQEKTGDREFVESMIVLIYELLPAPAREQILADMSPCAVINLELWRPPMLLDLGQVMPEHRRPCPREVPTDYQSLPSMVTILRPSKSAQPTSTSRAR